MRRGCWPYGTVLMFPQDITPIAWYHLRSVAVVRSSTFTHGGRIVTSYVLPVFGSAFTTLSAVYCVHQPFPSASVAVPYTKLPLQVGLSKCIQLFVSGSNRFAPLFVAPHTLPCGSTSTVVSCPPPMFSGGANISMVSVRGSRRPSGPFPPSNQMMPLRSLVIECDRRMPLPSRMT